MLVGQGQSVAEKGPGKVLDHGMRPTDCARKVQVKGGVGYNMDLKGSFCR